MWLGKAFKQAGGDNEQKTLKFKALDDPDLEPF
jgi:hypothetical protein